MKENEGSLHQVSELQEAKWRNISFPLKLKKKEKKKETAFQPP
jgi:hypothetical protein